MFLVTSAAAATCDGPRLALAIGNKAYPDNDPPFLEPIGNMRRMAQTLRQVGYVTETGEDLTKSQMQAALEDFTEKVHPGTIAFLFFSGIGLQASGHTYLIPVDAIIWSEQDVKLYGFNLDRIIGTLDAKGAKIRIAVVDGARRNPFERRFRTSGSIGLAPINGANETLAMYSNVPGAVFDESGATTSPFVEELAKEIEAPGATAEAAFRRTRVGVSHVQASQRPWISSSLSEDIAIDAQGCRKDVATRDDGPSTDKPPTTLKPARGGTLSAPPISPPASPSADERVASVSPDPGARKIDTVLGDPSLLEEVRDRLYEQNLDPGAVGSSDMDAAIRKFEKQAKLPESGKPTDGVLQSLREADTLKPWGAIVFATEAGRWGMSWGRPLRRQALDEAKSRCGSDRCTRQMSFFGKRCGAFALSARSWTITWRNGGDRARRAALEDCAKGGESCRLVGAVCADGSDRAN